MSSHIIAILKVAGELEPREVIVERIQQIEPEEVLRYRLPDVYTGIYGGEFGVIQLNPEYPRRGKKYSFSMERLVGDKPSGKFTHIWDTNSPERLADWILERNGKFFS